MSLNSKLYRLLKEKSNLFKKVIDKALLQIKVNIDIIINTMARLPLKRNESELTGIAIAIKLIEERNNLEAARFMQIQKLDYESMSLSNMKDDYIKLWPPEDVYSYTI